MYKYRSRDRRLMEQASRDLACMLQRDYRTFDPKDTTSLSNRIPYFSGYLSSGANAYPNISWTTGSQVDQAFLVLQQMLENLMIGTYQTPVTAGGKNPGAWPPSTVKWVWVLSVYAYVNPAYAAFATANNFNLPEWDG